MSDDETRDVMTRYLDSNPTDLSMTTSATTFTDMDSGRSYRGPEEIAEMQDFMYRKAFDAHVEDASLLISGGRAVLEATFVGKHIGEFAGIPATGRDVRVPLCVAYDLEGGKVARARIYGTAGALLDQLGRPAAPVRLDATLEAGGDGTRLDA